MSHRPAFIIHGHFYQPPRENPWTDDVDREPSAAPFHDWNQRIYRECYRPNGWARIFETDGAVRRIVNNYERLSFNFGPTLLSWSERHHPDGYRRILAADRASVIARGGHGNAIAQGYNHAILPLCNDRDLRTQVRWGLAEFKHRYGRDAESLWMPETACDDRTLGVLIDEGLRYALLAPNQAEAIEVDGVWHDVSDGSIDPRRPYRYEHPDGSGRSIALFFYDGAISRAVAFEGVLASSQALVNRFELASGGDGSVVHAVTDGESYGHHHRYGDRCLAHALFEEAERRGFWVTNYGELLDHHPAEIPVRVKKGEEGKGTSWSCAHGVGRWMRDCGCHTGGQPGWNQAWRGPLREALDHLRDRAAALYEARLDDWFDDPWALRDDYIEVVLRRGADRGAFLAERARRPLDASERTTSLRWLEAQRSSMLMYTSCGWFFNDLSGIETLQVLRYAGRLVDQLADMSVDDVEAPFLEQLSEARSNLSATGADLYRREVLPRRVHDRGLAAHVALTQLVEARPTEGVVAGRRYRLSCHEAVRRGRWTLGTFRVELEEVNTGAKTDHAACALHLGGVELYCVLRPYPGDQAFAASRERILQTMAQSSLLQLLRTAEDELGPEEHGLSSVLEGDRERLSRALFDEVRSRYSAQYEALYEEARVTLSQFAEAGLPIPLELAQAAETALRRRFEDALRRAHGDGFDPRGFEQALLIAEEARRYGLELSDPEAAQRFERSLDVLITRLTSGEPAALGADPISSALALLDTVRRLGLSLDLEPAQERIYEMLRDTAVPEDLARLARNLGLEVS